MLIDFELSCAPPAFQWSACTIIELLTAPLLFRIAQCSFSSASETNYFKLMGPSTWESQPVPANSKPASHYEIVSVHHPCPSCRIPGRISYTPSHKDVGAR